MLELKSKTNPDQFLKTNNMLHSWFFSKKRVLTITSVEDWTKTRQLISSAKFINLMDKVDDFKIHPHFLQVGQLISQNFVVFSEYMNFTFIHLNDTINMKCWIVK